MTPLKMPSDAPGEILRILRCPDCRQGGLEQAGGAFRCTACDRVYPVSDEIPDLRPAESLPLPGMYGDPDALHEMGRLLQPGGRCSSPCHCLRDTGPRRPCATSATRPHPEVSTPPDGIFLLTMQAMIEATPVLRIKERRYRVFLFSKLFMVLLKWVYFPQAFAYKMFGYHWFRRGFLSMSTRRFSSCFMPLFLIEDALLPPIFKGHILVLVLHRTEGS